MKEAFINATILDPSKNKEFIGDVIIEKDKIVDIGPNLHKKEKPKQQTHNYNKINVISKNCDSSPNKIISKIQWMTNCRINSCRIQIICYLFFCVSTRSPFRSCSNCIEPDKGTYYRC